jgi:hypothetical protein
MKRLEKIHALEMRLAQGLGPVNSAVAMKSISGVKDSTPNSLSSSSVKSGGTSLKDKSTGN